VPAPAHSFFWDIANSFSVKETIFYAGLKTECAPLEWGLIFTSNRISHLFLSGSAGSEAKATLQKRVLDI
jgi:hypothetical protein